MNKMKNWFSLRISVSPEVREAAANFCFELGCCGLEEHENSILAYFLGASPPENLKESLQIYINDLKADGLSVGNPDWISVPDEDWGRTWRQFFKPVHMTPRIVTKPPWESWPSSSEIVINIMPQMAFGTGTHETTQLCAELLEETIQPSSTVLDVGTGSGILSILAIKLGARKAVGLDIDPAAIDNARENVTLNHVEGRIEFHLGPLETLPPQTFDFILANINLLTLEKLLPMMSPFYKKDSLIVFSGVLAENLESLKNLCANSNLKILDVRQKNEWVGVRAKPCLC